MIPRRQFISLLGCAAAAWPVAVRGQQGERVRRIGVLMNLAADDPESQARLTAFAQGMQDLGWIDGRNTMINLRWGNGSLARIRQHAADLVALAPDVILANATPSVAALQAATSTVPVVFVNVIDPVGAGFVESLAHPTGNMTGFTPFEYGISAKWLELLKDIAPGVTRAAVLRDSASPTGIGHLAAMQSVAPLLKIEVIPISVRDAQEIERVVTTFAGNLNSGLIVTPSTSTIGHRELIINLAARYRLPAVYPFRFFAVGGGLLSYGPASAEPFRSAAQYVSRILNGEMPANLPVQAPTKYETVINLKTAKSLNLNVPPAVLARADEVIE